MSFPTIGSYQILREVGRGGMGVVYEALDPDLNRRIALKILPRSLAFNESFVGRFLREGRLAAALSHPNVVTVYEAGQSERQYFLAMEFVEGTDLRQLLLQKGKLELDLALEILDQVGQGMDAAHSQGIIHRDIKPENILLDTAGVAKVADFGIARAEQASGGTQTGTMIGTAEYMSPEQALGKPVDARSDVYSLACMAYEMLTGEPPFGRASGERTAISIINDHAHRRPPSARSANPHLRKGTDYALQKALDKGADNRYPSAGEFVSGLRHATAPLITLRGGTTVAGVVAVSATILAVWLQTHSPSLPSTRPLDKVNTARVRILPAAAVDPDKLPPVIEKAVRERINKPKGPLTAADVSRVTDLFLVGVTDLSPLAGFTNLQKLWLQTLKTTDLTPLATLTNLRELHVDNPQVKDLQPLTGLTELRELSLGTVEGTLATELSPLAQMTKLRRLSLDGSPVSDLRPLANLTALEELNLTSTPVQDLSPLESMSSLQTLFLEKTQVSSLAPLSRLSALKTLTLNNTPVSDLQPLANLTGLSRLELAYTQVSSLEALAALTELESLELKGTLVSDLSPLSNMNRLHGLNLESTSVRDLSPLSELIGLEYLYLKSTSVSDLTPLRSQMFLKEVDLRSTPVSDLRPLAGQLMLQVLYIADTRVSPEMEASFRRTISQCEVTRSRQAAGERSPAGED